MDSKANINQINEFRIIGISRSGNHAIINWIINQLDGSYCFLNCTEPKYNPFLTARPLSERGEIFQTNIENFDLKKEREGKFSRKDYLIYSHEDSFLGALNSREFIENREKWIGLSSVHKDLLILRDPFNLFASRIKSGFIRGKNTHHQTKQISTLILRRMYKQHAREFLGKKNYLKNKVPVNFNNWSTDKEYRRQLADRLDLPFTDKGFKEVSNVAGGSSFDGTKLSGKAHKMDLHNRWKEFASDEFFWSFFDAELVELSREIFGDIPPLPPLLNNDKIRLSPQN